MVYYSVNKAINDKKSVIAIQKKHLEYMYFISSPGYNHDVPNFTIENEQQISRVPSYLVWTSFNEIKKAHFQGQYRCLF